MIKILDTNFNRLGVIKNAIECTRREEINGENTLDFNAVLDAKLNSLIDQNSIFELDDEYFDTAFLKKVANEDNSYTVQIETESISYRLNDPLYNVEYFTEMGSPTYILGKILEGTNFNVGTVDFTQETTYSAQEAMSRRRVLMEFVAYLGGEVVFNKFTVSIVIRRGSDQVKLAIKDRNVKVVSKTVNKRSFDEAGNPLVSYECTPVYLPADEYVLGDSVRLMQRDLGINEDLRVVSISKDPYDVMNTAFEFANYTNGLESQLYRIATSTVIKDKLYNGTRIGPEFGFEAVRSDKKARAYFRSDEMKFQSGDGTGQNWVDQLYFLLDPDNFEMLLTFAGLLHGGRISIGGTYVDPMFKVDENGNVKAKSLEVSEHLKVIGKNTETTIDEWGINPAFMKRFPNKIFNSGFEWYDAETMKPMYWDGTGVSTAASNFDGSVALHLTPGQTLEQGMLTDTTHAGADPAWWDYAQTRVSFRHKGGAVRVYVRKVSDSSNYNLTDNSVEEAPVSGAYLDYGVVTNWENGLHSFYLQPTVGDGKVKIRFENVDASSDAYIDAVQIEPDFTGKWSSLYMPGPRSIPMGDVTTISPPVDIESQIDEYVEADLFAWNKTSVTYNFIQSYTLEPIVQVCLQGADVTTLTAPISFFAEALTDVNGKYTGVTVYPVSSAVLPDALNAKIAITCICREVVT